MEELRMYTAVSTTATAAPDGWTARIVAHLRRMLRLQAAAQRHLTRIETLVLAPRKTVHLIECDGRRFLITDGLSAPVATVADEYKAD